MVKLQWTYCLFILLFTDKDVISQCSNPSSEAAIFRQTNLFQLVGSVDGALDTPNGTQDMAGGYTLESGTWLNRGVQNLIRNGDFTLPGAPYPLRFPNGTGGHGQTTVQIDSIPTWTISGNSVNAYPYYAMNNGSVNPWQPTDFSASLPNIYLGNQRYSLCLSQPVFDHGYAVNSSSVNPYITATGISLGYGQIQGDPISIHQTINTVIGKKYRIQFFISGEGGVYAVDWIMGLDITGYSRSILLVPGLEKIRYEFEFKAIADTTVLSFINWGHSLTGTNTTEFILDDVIVNLVPDQCSVLPLKLISFTATKSENDVTLFWQTTNEQNTLRFQVQYSQDDFNWSDLVFIASPGNSTRLNNYNFIHHDSRIGYNYYRLKQIDSDGRFTYSKVVVIRIKSKDGIFVFPNPTSGDINICFDNSRAIKSVTLFTCDGKKIGELSGTENLQKLNLNKSPSGIYFLCVVTRDGQKKFIKIKRI